MSLMVGQEVTLEVASNVKLASVGAFAQTVIELKRMRSCREEESECSSVGRALALGARARWFDPSHSDCLNH